MNINLKKDSNRILLLLIATDIAFILGHFALLCLHKHDAPMFMLDIDGSYPEFLGYIKEFWLVVLCLLLAYKGTTKSLYVGWAGLFVYFLLDDAISIHERLGMFAVSWLHITPIFSFRAQDIGELLATGAMGTLIFLLIGIGYLSGNTQERKATHSLFGLVLLLVFFGVVVDMIHGAMPPSRLNAIVAMIEDGGEMIAMSLIAWFVFSLTPALLTTRKEEAAVSFTRAHFYPSKTSLQQVGNLK